MDEEWIAAGRKRTLAVVERRLKSWPAVIKATDSLSHDSWLFRGHERAEWNLETTFEREFGGVHNAISPLEGLERELVSHFARRAPQLLPGHLVPGDNDVAAWLG